MSKDSKLSLQTPNSLLYTIHPRLHYCIVVKEAGLEIQNDLGSNLCFIMLFMCLHISFHI